MKRRTKKIAVDQLIKQEKARSEPERVIALAAMGLSIRQIAIELGRSEDFVRSNYAKEINRGIVHGAATVRKVIYKKAMLGNHACLSYLMFTLNHERYEPIPKIVKDVMADEKARPRPGGCRPQSGERLRDSNGRFLSAELASQ